MSLTQIKRNTRTYTIRRDTGYAVPSRGLICSWAVADPSVKFIPILILDGVTVRGVPRANPYKICVSEIRQFARDVDCENPSIVLDNIESIMYIGQIYATEFYPSVSSEDLFNCVLTRDYKTVQLSFGVGGPETVDIIEEFWDRCPTQITHTDEDKDMQDLINSSSIKPINSSVVKIC